MDAGSLNSLSQAGANLIAANSQGVAAAQAAMAQQNAQVGGSGVNWGNGMISYGGVAVSMQPLPANATMAEEYVSVTDTNYSSASATSALPANLSDSDIDAVLAGVPALGDSRSQLPGAAILLSHAPDDAITPADGVLLTMVTLGAGALETGVVDGTELALGEGTMLATSDTTADGVGSVLPKIYTSATPVEDEYPALAGINPGYGEVAGTTTNCVSCTNAFMERMSGNLEAVATPGPTQYGSEIAVYGLGQPMSASDAITEIQGLDEGTYGAATINDAHAVGFINDGGTAVFVDTQSGQVVTLSSDVQVKIGTSVKIR